MLIGYNNEGDIKFIFSDDNYLKQRFPNNTAKISDFWKVKDHGLKEFFIDDFKDINNIDDYHIVNTILTKRNNAVDINYQNTATDNINLNKNIVNNKLIKKFTALNKNHGIRSKIKRR